ncbi:hypothetical protein LLEC1_06052 [Akanthomyces lecanii]|uniref:1-alkyl-2-acetylglycerophosphocholine esterase n=1 Tax=Cordyceps confragosa TaxID=2714763 RepID=A0A179I8Z3_CORDF|nr:hypothetical protein LLEC1_06052 [Akanthomyces lecanii]
MFMLTIALFALPLQAVLIPGPPGPQSVSYQVLELTDDTRWDPYAPVNNPHKRRIVVSSYLPVDHEQEICAPAALPFMPPQTAVAYGSYAAANGIPDDVFQDIQLDFCQLPGCAAGRAARKYPVVIFSPGLSASRLLYSNQARALSSHGFVVLTIDHCYDAMFVEFSDGSFIRGTVGFTDEESDNATRVRAQDVSFVIDLLHHRARGASLPENILRRADLAKLIVYGHSLGGATAAQVVLLDQRVLGGIDVDGSPWAESKQQGLDKPFVMLGKGTKNGIDETWAPFYQKLKGSKMQLRVEGATHYAFTDVPQVFAARPLPPKYDDLVRYLAGTVEAGQMEKVIISVLTGFGSLVLDGERGPLLGLNKTFPEVLVVGEQL